MRRIFLLSAMSAFPFLMQTTPQYPIIFQVEELSDAFQAYEGLPDTCSDLSKDCVKGGHAHARRCIGMFYSEKRAEIAECKNENEDLQQASREWQEASFAWHKGIQDCLAGEDAPAAEASRVFFYFRRKRVRFFFYKFLFSFKFFELHIATIKKNA